MPHDYRLEWDYDVTVPRRDFLELTGGIIEQIERDISDMIPSFEIGFVKNTGRVGIFIYGTEERPVVALDVGCIRRTTRKYGIPLYAAIESTIMHELGHALQALHGLDFDEDVAEDFAFNYWLDGTIKKFWLL